MTISFPSSPSNGQIFSPGGGAPSYIYNSSIGAWQIGTGLFGSLYAPLTISSTAPASPSTGYLWWNTNDGRLYIYAGAWVTAINDTVPIASTTALGAIKVGSGLAVSSSGVLSTPVYDVGRNKFHNPLFTIAQRGAGPFTTAGYTLDRWLFYLASDTISVTQVALSDADRAAIGDEEAAFGIQNVFTGNAGAGAYNILGQKIENVRRLAGKVVTVSFWAKAASGSPKIGISIDLESGTGGSPFGEVQMYPGTAVTLSTSWARYSATFSMPTLQGQTVGTNGDSCSQVLFWMSTGSTFNVRSGGIGVQSATIQFWGMQCEFNALTPLEKPDPPSDLANCQRHYQYHTAVLCASSYNGAGGTIWSDFSYPVTMRAIPHEAYDTVSYGNASGLLTNAVLATHIRFSIVITATGNGYAGCNLALSAEL